MVSKKLGNLVHGSHLPDVLEPSGGSAANRTQGARLLLFLRHRCKCSTKLMTLMTCFDRAKESSFGPLWLGLTPNMGWWQVLYTDESMKFMDRILHQLISSLSMSTCRMFYYYRNRFTRFCSSSLRMAIEWTQRLWSLQIKAVLKIFSRTGDSPYRPQTCSHTGESTSLIPFSRWSVEAMTRAMWTCTKSLWTKFQVNFRAISSSKFFGTFFTSHGFDVFLLRSGLTPNGNRTPGATVLPKSRGTGKSWQVDKVHDWGCI